METSKAMNLSLLIFRWLILVGGLSWILTFSRKVSFPWLFTVGQSLVILGQKYDLEVEWIWVLKLSALVSIEMSVCGRREGITTTRGLKGLRDFIFFDDFSFCSLDWIISTDLHYVHWFLLLPSQNCSYTYIVNLSFQLLFKLELFIWLYLLISISLIFICWIIVSIISFNFLNTTYLFSLNICTRAALKSFFFPY